MTFGAGKGRYVRGRRRAAEHGFLNNRKPETALHETTEPYGNNSKAWPVSQPNPNPTSERAGHHWLEPGLGILEPPVLFAVKTDPSWAPDTDRVKTSG